MTADEHKKLMADVNAFCEELRPTEELAYVEHHFNDQLVPLAKKHNVLGMTAPKELGGRGANTVAYVQALARIGREEALTRPLRLVHPVVVCSWRIGWHPLTIRSPRGFM